MNPPKKKNIETQDNNGRKSIVLGPTSLVLVTYILLLLSRLIDVTLINRDNEYLSVVLLQMMIFLIPGAIWCRMGTDRYLKTLRIKMFEARSTLLIISASALMISGGVLISLLFGGLESLSQNFSLYNTFVSKDDGTLPVKLYLLLAYAALPAICEEFVFRGILCRELEKGGVVRAVSVSALFFGLLHFDLANLPVYLFSGVILALVLYATRSLLGAIVAHFIYNLFGLFGQPYISTFYNITKSTELFIIVFGVVFFASATVFFFEASRLYRHYLYRAYPSSYRAPVLKDHQSIKASYLRVLSAPSALLCYLLYIIVIIVSLF